MSNVLALLSVLIFIYAVLGVQLFHSLLHQQYIHEYRNFHTLPNAMLLLFQSLTIDHWSFVMSDAMITPDSVPPCDPSPSPHLNNCGGWYAMPYCVSFQIVGSFVLLNVLVAVILDDFTSLGKFNPDLASMAHVEHFTHVSAMLQHTPPSANQT